VEKRQVNPWTWQDNFGFSQAVEVSGQQRTLVCAGQTSVDDSGAPTNPGDMGAQVNSALDNLETVLKQAGMSLANVVRLNYYTTDVEAFLGASQQASARLKAAGCAPASTLLGVARLAFPELMIELEATAVA
jgi:2-iminobutanoate/2-iminopropanoate deaminase